jgi:hypothetical protein
MKSILLPRLSLALAMAAGISVALADTITLKNGKIITNCVILSETADAYKVEVAEAGGTIKEETTIKKADVAKVERVMPEDREAEDMLSKLKPTPDGMSAAEYDKRIKTQIQPWLDKYKTSAKRKNMEELLKLYNDELAKVKAGEIKLRTVWITVDEQKWNEYNVSARKLRGKFEELLKAKRYVDAYNVFATMEASGGASVDFPPVLEAQKKAMPQFVAAVGRAIEENPALVEDRKKLLEQSTPDEKRKVDAAIKAETDEFRKKSALEKKNKIRVPSFNPYDLKTIQATLDAAKKEAVYLAGIDIPSMTLANKKFENGLREMNSKAYLSAKTNFEGAAKFHSKDATVKKWLDDATKAVEAAKKKPVGK